MNSTEAKPCHESSSTRRSRNKERIRDATQPISGTARSQSGSRADSGENSSAEWKVGDVILDLYEVTRVHQGGGMGFVYRVFHRGWHTDLAMKSPRGNYFRTESQKQNFIRECETWVALGLHPHITNCFYIRSIAGIPRVFAEYLESGSLKEWIKGGKLYEGGAKIALKRILNIAIQMAWGLQYTHENGVIHQDIKPANVLMAADGRAKITDFGLAKARVEAGETDTPGENILVTAGGMTPAYCSPEQMRKEPLTPQTDVWSWAVSVIEMFAGRVFWKSGLEGPNALNRLAEEWQQQDAVSDIRVDMVRLLETCLDADASRRPGFLTLADRLRTMFGNLFPDEDVLENAPEPGQLLADGLNNRGVSFWDLGKTREAEDFFEKALDAQPEHPQATFNRNLVRWSTGRETDSQAVAAMESLREHNPRDWVPLYLLGLAHLRRRDIRGALGYLENAAQLNPTVEVLKAREEARAEIIKSPGCIRSFEGHRDWVKSVAISADGRWILTGSADRTARFWDGATGECLRVFEGHKHWINSVALSADGAWAASASGDNTLRLWNTRNGECARVFQGHTDWVSSVALSVDGRWLISGGGDRTVRLWDCATGMCLEVFQGLPEWVNAVAMSADAHWAIAATIHNDLHVWDLSQTIRAVCALTAGEPEAALRRWDTKTGSHPRTLSGHTGRVNAVSLSADGFFAASGSHDKTVRLWDLKTGICAAVLKGHMGWVNCAALSADAKTVLSGDTQGTLRLWNTKTGACLRTFQEHTDWVNSVAISANQRFAVSAGIDRALLWNLGANAWPVQNSPLPLALCKVTAAAEMAKTASRFNALINEAKSLAARGDRTEAVTKLREAQSIQSYRGSRAAAELANAIGRFGVKREPRALRILRNLDGHTDAVNALAFSKDGRTAISAGSDGAVRFWEVASGRCLRLFQNGGSLEGGGGAGTAAGAVRRSGVRAVAFAEDGECAAWGCDNGSINVWSGNGGCFSKISDAHLRPINTIAMSRDKRWLVSGGADEAIHVWESAGGTLAKTFEGRHGSVLAMVLTPDSCGAVTLSEDKKPRLWDLATGKCQRVFTGLPVVAASLAIARDGAHFVAGCADGALRLWNIAEARCLKVLSGHEARVNSVALTAAGRWAVSAGADHALRLWDLKTGHCVRVIERLTEGVRVAALSLDGRWLISGDAGGLIRLRELEWNYDFPATASWDENATAFLKNFLHRHRRPAADGFGREGPPSWTDDDFQGLLDELQMGGFGWLQAEGVRERLGIMAQAYAES
jgi:WD40 repeat protein